MARAWVVTHSLGRKWVGKSTDASQVLDALPTEAGQARQLAVALHSVARWQRVSEDFGGGGHYGMGWVDMVGLWDMDGVFQSFRCR